MGKIINLDRSVIEVTGDDAQKLLNDTLTCNLSKPLDVSSIIDAAKSGNTRARSVLDRAAKMFAMGLANLVNIFDPKLIILSGERMQFDFLYADDVIESIKDIIIQVDAAPPQILVHKWGDMMWAKGAAAYAIERLDEIAVNGMSVA